MEILKKPFEPSCLTSLLFLLGFFCSAIYLVDQLRPKEKPSAFSLSEGNISQNPCMSNHMLESPDKQLSTCESSLPWKIECGKGVPTRHCCTLLNKRDSFYQFGNVRNTTVIFSTSVFHLAIVLKKGRVGSVSIGSALVLNIAKTLSAQLHQPRLVLQMIFTMRLLF